jgi:hypothetical protein
MDKEKESIGEEKARIKRYWQNYIHNLTKTRDIHKNREKLFERKVDFTQDLILGLMLGIFGNLFVQYLFAFTEGWLSKDILVYSNTIVFIISAIFLVILFYRFRKDKKYAEGSVYIEKEEQQILTNMLIKAESILKDLDKEDD